jgi:fibronectin type 3 domain-containing protein
MRNYSLLNRETFLMCTLSDRNLFILVALLLINSLVYSQTNEEVKPAVKATAFAYSDSIAIRWAPTTPVAWQLANKYGYYIERVTITRNNKIIRPEKIKIVNEPLKPWPEERRKKLIETNDMAAVAAQAIFGSSFETTSDYKSDVLQVINQSKEIEQRYSFALFAADLSRVTARASAIGWVDKHVRKDEKYLYKIYSAVPANTLKVDTGFVFIGIEDKRELPKPAKVSALPDDRTVLINWARNYYDDVYVAYHVEKSDDGKSFKNISDLPIINTEPAKGLPADKFYKLDSLKENNKPYYYRVRGLTPFGDMGPPSEVITASGIKPLEATAGIVKAEVENNAKVLISWMFPQEAASELKGFNVLRSNKADATFKQINAQLVSAEKREYIDEAPLSTNYYKIQAISKYEQSSISFPRLVQLEDSIPPLPPKDIQAIPETSGVVRLSWRANTESDLAGYRVFRSNYRGDEYSQITTSPVTEAVFIDTVSTKTLTDKIYYKVAAVDTRFNTSPFSTVLEVKRPDVVPPVPAVFQSFKIKDASVVLSWALSPSSDVVRYELWRSGTANEPAALISSFLPQDGVRSYTDSKVKSGSSYNYRIITIDDNGLSSATTQALKVSLPNIVMSQEAFTLTGTANRTEKKIELRWKSSIANVERINIYRARGQEPFTLYKTIIVSSGFDDLNVEMNATYRYCVQALLPGGASGKISKELVVNY